MLPVNKAWRNMTAAEREAVEKADPVVAETLKRNPGAWIKHRIEE